MLPTVIHYRVFCRAEHVCRLVRRAGRDDFLTENSYYILLLIVKIAYRGIPEYSGDSLRTEEASGRALVTMRNIVGLVETVRRAGWITFSGLPCSSFHTSLLLTST
jgi:hypothetical protein